MALLIIFPSTEGKLDLLIIEGLLKTKALWKTLPDLCVLALTVTLMPELFLYSLHSD